MLVRYNYRLNPTTEQRQLLVQVAGNQRYIWNFFLNQEIIQYQETQTFNFYNKNSASLPSLKNDLEWLKVGPSQSLQQTLKDLDNALKTSFKGLKNNKRGFPKFKKKKEFSASFRIVQTPDLWKYTRKSITLPKIGPVKWRYHRKIPSDFSTATILLDGNKWYISIVIDLENKQPIEITKFNQVVGIDLNSKILVMTSNGEVIDNPKYFKKYKKQIAKKQKQLAKRVKGSKRYKKKHLELYNKNKKLRQSRTNFLHQISNQITNDYDLMCYENLNVKAIQQFNGKIVHDAGWAVLFGMIKYKSILKGKHAISIHRFAPSTKTCNHCGTIQTIELHERIYNCQSCNVSIDRDLNAAMNIRDWGLFDFLRQHTSGTEEINGRGDTSIGEVTLVTSRYVSLNRQKFFLMKEANTLLE